MKRIVGDGEKWKLRPVDEADDPVTLNLGAPNDGIEVQLFVPGGWESLTPVRARALAFLLMDATDAAEAAREAS